MAGFSELSKAVALDLFSTFALRGGFNPLKEGNAHRRLSLAMVQAFGIFLLVIDRRILEANPDRGAIIGWGKQRQSDFVSGIAAILEPELIDETSAASDAAYKHPDSLRIGSSAVKLYGPS